MPILEGARSLREGYTQVGSSTGRTVRARAFRALKKFLIAFLDPPNNDRIQEARQGGSGMEAFGIMGFSFGSMAFIFALSAFGQNLQVGEQLKGTGVLDKDYKSG